MDRDIELCCLDGLFVSIDRAISLLNWGDRALLRTLMVQPESVLIAAATPTATAIAAVFRNNWCKPAMVFGCGYSGDLASLMMGKRCWLSLIAKVQRNVHD